MPAGLKRIYGQGHLHFITFSCYQRLPLLRTVRARDIFVQELGKLRYEMVFHLIGYVVMPEHVHLPLSEPPRGTPSTVLSSWSFYEKRKVGLIGMDVEE
jgi:putative transposase